MKTKVQILREEKSMTQTELAQKSGLSLRTIQRIEAGNIPKGHTLRTIAYALDTGPENLLHATSENTDFIKRAKLINMSALSSLIIPFGNIIFPAILTYNTKDEKAKAFGKEIISFQLVYTFVLGILLILSPFIQKVISIRFPIFLVVLLLMKCINFYIIFKNGLSLNQKQELYIRLKNSFI